MGKYLITGRQGAGKTTVIKLLRDKGYAAYNTDALPDITKLQNRETGEVIEWSNNKVDWAKFAWNWQEGALKQLLASNDEVFIGAVVSNQTNFYYLFDKVFVLTVDANTLRSRLETHEHENHHIPGEVDRILADHENKQDLFIEEGAIPISANRPPDEIANDILNQIGSPTTG